MEYSKVFLFFALVAAANCYTIASDDRSFSDNANDVPAFYLQENYGEAESYRPSRNVHFDEETLFTVENPDGSYTIDDVDPALIEELFRAKRQDRNSVSVTADHQHRQGTNVNIEAQRNLWQSNNGQSSLDAQANYNRQFGHGGGRPDYGAGVTFRHRF